MTSDPVPQFGCLAATAGERLLLQVMKSAAGFYLGTQDRDGLPYTRESVQYWPKRDGAETALRTGHWTQRLHL
jgi:hypothetical protein